ncbi:MAG TPA: hypothetical protein VJU59_15240 [Paraburkholderia sp.]|uniref:hypothetical protein n=1 Tax=Paraburkholderia sp. TaxID=1926495 RepID=UPI002B46A410|nr:hypothetical protein [Paraburkholderia sp.]HKR41007.1 hypothetical protein [Paraburkholderia sp.]
MSEIDWGGPAFPFVEPNVGCNVAVGMTLRDYFAAKAICGTLPGKGFSDAERDEYAKLAYQMADAMIRARGES